MEKCSAESERYFWKETRCHDNVSDCLGGEDENPSNAICVGLR